MASVDVVDLMLRTQIPAERLIALLPPALRITRAFHPSNRSRRDRRVIPRPQLSPRLGRGDGVVRLGVRVSPSCVPGFLLTLAAGTSDTPP